MIEEYRQAIDELEQENERLISDIISRADMRQQLCSRSIIWRCAPINIMRAGYRNHPSNHDYRGYIPAGMPIRWLGLNEKYLLSITVSEPDE